MVPCVHALNTTVQTDKSFLTLLKKCKYAVRVPGSTCMYAAFLISATCNFNKVPFITTCSAFTFHSRFTRTFHHHHRHHLSRCDSKHFTNLGIATRCFTGTNLQHEESGKENNHRVNHQYKDQNNGQYLYIISKLTTFSMAHMAKQHGINAIPQINKKNGRGNLVHFCSWGTK